jgi:hypothetical protein
MTSAARTMAFAVSDGKALIALSLFSRKITFEARL